MKLLKSNKLESQELDKERIKFDKIQIREKEVIKLEPKCVKCKEKEYISKLAQLKIITYGSLIYSIIITVINIIKNDFIKNDFKTCFKQIWSSVCLILKNANMSLIRFSSHINNEIAQKILYIIVWGLIAGVVIFGVYKLYIEIQYKTWKFWNTGAVTMVLLDLILIVFFSEQIKNFTKLNLFIFALIVYAGYIVIRIIVNIKKARNFI